MELLARVQGEGFLRFGPPDEEELEEVFKLERAVRSGVLLRGPDTEGEPNVRDEPTVGGTPTGVRPGAGRRVLRLALPTDLADLWMGLEALYERRRFRGVGSRAVFFGQKSERKRETAFF
jgi:hypothetical protein